MCFSRDELILMRNLAGTKKQPRYVCYAKQSSAAAACRPRRFVLVLNIGDFMKSVLLFAKRTDFRYFDVLLNYRKNRVYEFERYHHPHPNETSTEIERGGTATSSGDQTRSYPNGSRHLVPRLRLDDNNDMVRRNQHHHHHHHQEQPIEEEGQDVDKSNTEQYYAQRNTEVRRAGAAADKYAAIPAASGNKDNFVCVFIHNCIVKTHSL